MKKRLNIFVVSDATGHTAESVLTSVLVQFRGAHFNVRRFPFVRAMSQLDEIVDLAPDGKCIIVFTLVSLKLRRALSRKGKTKGLTMIDVTGPLLSIFAKILDYSPRMEPGVFRHTDEDTYLVTEAIQYTITHDDGMGLDTVDQADLIILGISRTGKTPTSIFLSCRKLKVANIPIVLDMPLEPEIAKLPVKKVGFRMGLERQIELRSERAGRMAHANVPGYSNKQHVVQEMEFCEKEFRKIPGLWTIDVTNRSIEETSEWITRNVLGNSDH